MSILLLSGCDIISSFEPSLSVSEVSLDDVDGGVLSFFQSVQDENGVYLYFDNENDAMYIYLNGSNVIDGEEATYFTDFDIEEEDDMLKLSYTSEQTTDYSDQSLDYERFYKIISDQDYEGIKLYGNGQEVSFDTVSGNP